MGEVCALLNALLDFVYYLTDFYIQSDLTTPFFLSVDDESDVTDHSEAEM